MTDGHGISWGEAWRTWLRVAALSFGGPAGQIAVMHRILVEEKRWVGETRFLHALNYCMLLPGPEAQQLTVYIGWLMHRVRGGLVAGTLFVLPGVVAIMALSWLYALYGSVAVVQALFFGLKAAVLAIVVEAVIRIGRRALRGPTMTAVAFLAFVAIFVFGVSFPLIIVTAGVLGYVGQRCGVPGFSPGGGHRAQGGAALADADSALGAGTPAHARPSPGRALAVILIALPLWLGPIAAIFVIWGGATVFDDIAIFFAKMAVVTFGGAYAVLAYVAQEAVAHYHWLRPGEMLDGLGMAETTPGPLIMVVQFVGFMAAFRDASGMPPLLAGTLGGLLATWVTFAPCFLWIFLGAPYIEALRGNKALGAALGAITAAVVGVILNLALWFALHLWFGELHRAPGLALDIPVWSSLNGWALALSVASMVAIFRFRAGMITTLGGCSAAGVALYLAGLAG